MNNENRLNKNLFNKVFCSGRTSYSSNFIIKFQKNSLNKRIGISVSKKFFKKAINRNRIKRQIKSMISPIIINFKNIDLIIVVKKGYDFSKYDNFKKELIVLLEKNKILI